MLQEKQETLRFVTIAMVYSTLASSWKFQYFQNPIYNPVKHLWWSFYWKSNKLLTIFTKGLIKDARLGSKYVSAFTTLQTFFFFNPLRPISFVVVVCAWFFVWRLLLGFVTIPKWQNADFFIGSQDIFWVTCDPIGVKGYFFNVKERQQV